MDSPGSELSEHSDHEFQDEEAYHHNYMSGASPSPTDPTPARPAKRQKTGPSSHRDHGERESISHATIGGPLGNFTEIPPDLLDGDISSDTDGSVPGSPHMAASSLALPGDEEDGGHRGEQVSYCRWEGCPAGELGNMDLLVGHLHDEHIHARQKKYSCEWEGCQRKGIAHASGYALRAHMRSHTREKPFYCTLPECDRSFTRSDALAKHMRTVHETEALRPSDPVPKHHSSNPQNKNQKLRLTFKAIGSVHSNGNGTSVGAGSTGGGPGSDAGRTASVPASPMTGPRDFGSGSGLAVAVDEEWEHNNVVYLPSPALDAGRDGEMTKQFPPDINFSEEELALDPAALYHLLKQQLIWASEDGEVLRKEVFELDEKRKKEWLEKELALENLMEAAAEDVDRRPKATVDEAQLVDVMKSDVRKFELTGEPTPWWRSPRREKDDGGGAMEGVVGAGAMGVAV